MTGGVGFSSTGRDSFKQNRKLLNRRGTQKDNPYSADNKIVRHPNKNVQELIDWKIHKNKMDRRIQLIIWTAIFIGVITSISIYFIL